MVVFTCNNCGDSVNKPKVDKHIQYECKRKHFAVSFCCVDCLKDFNHETVRAHCQCVTEEQRYSAKGFVPNPSSEKGKRKQAGWIDIVQSVIDRKDLQNDEKQLLNIVAKFDNVPRKKNKFQNFCYSTASAYRKKQNLVDRVFEMIEAEYKAQVQNSNKKPADTNNMQNKNDAGNLEKNDSIKEEPEEAKKKKKDVENSSNETEETPQKIKKKKKKSLDTVTNEIETKPEENIVPQSEKKKKKKKENNTVSEENMEIKHMAVEQIQSELSEKSKKNIKKSEVKKSNGISKTENGITNGENEIHEKEESQMSKKKKKKMVYQQQLATVTNGITNGENGIHEKSESQMSKKEKKKMLYQQKLATVTNSVTYGENVIHEKMETQIGKKEKKEMKKNKKYQQELATVTSSVIETEKEPPLSKKKKRKLNNNEKIEEPHQKILKIEEVPQDPVPVVQSGRKFEWNTAINQVLQSKKNKPMSISKVMKRVMNEYHFLNETTKKTENELEKIFLKKLKKIKNVIVDNDKVQLV